MKSYKDTQFGGKSFSYPVVGDSVLIKEGEYSGEELEVVGVRGCAFAKARRIHVLSPEGDELWYWPWNIDCAKK